MRRHHSDRARKQTTKTTTKDTGSDPGGQKEAALTAFKALNSSRGVQPRVGRVGQIGIEATGIQAPLRGLSKALSTERKRGIALPLDNELRRRKTNVEDRSGVTHHDQLNKERAEVWQLEGHSLLLSAT
jgi:hypothetical protein